MYLSEDFRILKGKGWRDVVDQAIEEARALSGRPYLTPADARRRYVAILRALAVGGRKHSWIAEQIDCSPSNASRLISAARRALAAGEVAL